MKINKDILTEIRQFVMVFAAFFLMVGVVFIFISRIMPKQINASAQATMRSADLTIRSHFREIEITLQEIAYTIQKLKTSEHSMDQISTYLAEHVEWLKQINSGIPGVMDMYGYIQGVYLSGPEWLPNIEYDPTDEPWYLEAVKNQEPVVISNPVPNKYLERTIISASTVLTDAEGLNNGVIAIDFDLSVLSGSITSLHFNEGGYGALINQNFEYVIHPNPAYVGKKISEFRKYEYLLALQTGSSGAADVFSIQFYDNTYGEIIAYYHCLKNGWIIAITISAKKYYSDVWFMAKVLVALGFILFIMLSFLLHRLHKERIQSDTENKSKSYFLAKMSHEIRTPMNAILGVSELLIRKDVSGKLHEYISIINHAGNSLLAIINDILDFSKIESGQLNIEEKKYHLSSLINDVINVMRVRFTDKAVNFFVTVNCNIPAELIGDEVRIRQVLINLLNNAAKYTERGFVRLAVVPCNMDEKKLELRFVVSDSGIGIKKADMDRLFNDFFRIESHTTQSIEGTGLGLTIARSLCYAMGGEILVTSEYGQGSEFTARIIQRYESPAPLARVKGAREKRVLIFEERPLFREALVDALVNLEVSPVNKITIEDFIQELETNRWDFAFVSSKYTAECAGIMEKKKNQAHLVFMAELGESSVFRDISSIMVPIYSVTLANVLNGSAGAGNPVQKECRNFFTAPGVKVLIVDDISTNLKVASELMAPYNMDIQTCLYGRESVELIRKNRYDLVFMDHMMPNMDGIEATAAIRAMGKEDPYFLNLPVIMLTANALNGQREMFLQNGSNDFLAKPIEMKKLNVILKTWIPKSKQIRQAGEKTDICVDTGSLPEIPGVETRTGLNNAGGTVRVYMDVLEDYCQSVKDRLVQIKEAAENRDFELYTTLVHGIKGASHSVGAMTCGDYAVALEEAGKNKDERKIQEKTGELLELFSRQIQTITMALCQYQNEQKTAKKTGLSDLHMEKLKKALSDMDIETVNRLLMEFSLAALEGKIKETVSEIEQHVLMFEYDKALEKIDMLL